MNALKLILKRFSLQLGYRLWSGVSIIIFLFVLVFILYLFAPYECPVRRALGFPLSRSENAGTDREQDCETGGAKP
jgi:hypothetical protein